ncbi:MAG: hypothetical protein ETSY2_11900 [Candidatus Entotheonella gemina]|uniref:PAS domain-containing protein n=1 Tax=Candidatus Entotheonella gemina TaxID=1429439 RepID=W4MAY2_9BACT|nr:MAG: hypothetical protein ETSY2_11900 [Candidatus Entotheonella gemina]
MMDTEKTTEQLLHDWSSLRYRIMTLCQGKTEESPEWDTIVQTGQELQAKIDHCLELLREIHARHTSESRKRKQVEGALRASEERYRELFENASDVLYTIELKHKTVTAINKAAERLLGYHREELIGLPIDQFLLPESYDASLEMGQKKH